MTTGILSYGVALPRFRLRTEEIAATWGSEDFDMPIRLGVTEKTVADKDEDTATLATHAAHRALQVVPEVKPQIGAVYIGSESHPYAVKPTAGMVGAALGLAPAYRSADLEFACKAGTAGMQMVASMIAAGDISAGIAIGADTAQAEPGNALEYTAAAGAAAFILGADADRSIATLNATTSYTTDTPDFWRGKYEHYPSHGDRFTGEPGYFHHVQSGTEQLLEETGTQISDYDHVVFHMPNGSFPKRVAKKLGVTKEQLAAGFIVPEIGNTYSACSMLGLARVLSIVTPGQRILVTSYGSGAGADSFAFTTTEHIATYQPSIRFDDLAAQKQFVSYAEYTVMRGKL